MPKVGERLFIHGRTDGTGRFSKFHRPDVERITVVYADGSVQVSSGDFYNVKRVKGRWYAK